MADRIVVGGFGRPWLAGLGLTDSFQRPASVFDTPWVLKRAP